MKTSSTLNKPGKLVLFVGPAGSGKTTMEELTICLYPKAQRVISDTTRSPRPHEISGQHYNFVSIKIFQERIQQDYYAEWEEVHGNYYGTPKEALNTALTTAQIVLRTIDYKGALKLIQLHPGSVIVIFLRASPETLFKRIQKRKDITPEEIARRMHTAEQELAMAHTFEPDVVDTDGTVTYTFERVKHILRKRGVDVDTECSECP